MLADPDLSGKLMDSAPPTDTSKYIIVGSDGRCQVVSPLRETEAIEFMTPGTSLEAGREDEDAHTGTRSVTIIREACAGPRASRLQAEPWSRVEEPGLRRH